MYAFFDWDIPIFLVGTTLNLELETWRNLRLLEQSVHVERRRFRMSWAWGLEGSTFNVHATDTTLFQNAEGQFTCLLDSYWITVELTNLLETPNSYPWMSRSLPLSPTLSDEFHWSRNNCEDLAHYKPGGYHPVHLGDIFSRYRVMYKLGFGAFSTVWLARDLSEDQ